MEKDTHTTEVLFRRKKSGEYKGEITAVFPYLIADPQGNYTIYAHIGQHGSGSPEWMRAHTVPATPEQYTALKNELEGLGYNLRIIQRVNRKRHNKAYKDSKK
jgi:hypothetical protein